MSRLLSVFFVLLLSAQCFAQSESAYIKAGDEAMLNKDPVSATAYYLNALEYRSSCSTMQKTGAAWKARFNYKSALEWYRKSLQENPDPEEKANADRNIYDLLKRSGELESAALFASQCTSPFADSLYNDYSKVILQPALELYVVQQGNEINSGYSDFAPHLMGDSVFIFSSNRYKDKDGKAISKVLRSAVKDTIYTKADLWQGPLNPPGKHTANVSVSEDGKVIVFAICEENDAKNIVCKLYECRRTDSKWTEAEMLEDSVINLNGYTSTQPCISTNREKGYVLYFASDRPGGKGGMDLWKSERDARGKYSTPVNIPFVNTPKDELTPWYDGTTDTLYFAAERKGGFGGLDLWKVKTGDSLQLNCGRPVNSGYDDLYLQTRPAKENALAAAFVVSNRPPSKTFKGETCCYDIFRLEPFADNLMKRDSAAAFPVITDTLAYVRQKDATLKTLLPLRLYFDNDYPDPRSRKPETTALYTDLLEDYLARRDEFSRQALTESDRNAIEAFFSDSVTASGTRLETFTKGLEELLRLGYKIDITLQGSASPLADSRYNVILSERRISSLLNHWLQSGPEILRSALINGDVRITRDAAGEMLSGAEIDDRADSASQSVYGLKASKLRRIEITSLTLSK